MNDGRKNSRRRFICLCLPACLIIIAGATGLRLALCPRPPLLDGTAFSRLVLDRRGTLLRMGLSADQSCRMRIALKDIAPELIRATLLYEDRHFYRHPGFNPLSLMRAAFSVLRGERRVGASTITMQVARLRLKLNTSSMAGKLAQIARAVEYERHYSKDELLEAYFNLAPYGGNIEGAGAAAWAYFGKSAARLNAAEALALAVIPQNPSRRTLFKAAGDESGEAERARLRLAALYQEHYPEALRADAPLRPPKANRLPFAAPHVAAELLAEAGPEQIRTGIDARTQQIVEGMLTRFAARGRAWGVENAAALLIHCPSMEIRALVGSANFANPAIEGQVDGTRARRSPGSTLKPFIYALALDQGLIHPLSLLVDSPRSFGGYDPENFDKSFRGPLSAQAALAASRNIPAISLAARLENPDLYSFLLRAGVKLGRDADHYGLSLVLGGAEVNMRELGALYASLAGRGLWRPARLRPAPVDAPEEAPLPLLSPEAAFITRDMLRDPAHSVRTRAGRLPLYLKTGTSNGFRDAWTAGLFGPYALVVWVGNFNNNANPLFIGAEAALPLFVDISQALADAEPLEDMTRELRRDLKAVRIPVCAATGDTDISLCPQTVETWFIPGVSPIASSGIFRKILIDKESGLRACMPEEGRTEEVVREFWPSNLQRIFRRAGLHKPPPPAWEPGCSETMREDGPRITLPKENVVYRVRLSVPDQGKVPLSASAGAENGTLFWFAGKEFIGAGAPEETLIWNAKPGLHVVRVVDDKGRSHSRLVPVEAVP